MHILFTDGGCTNSNQKDQSIRKLIMVVSDSESNILSETYMDGGSNNIAELLAIESALQVIENRDDKQDYFIKTDSKVAMAWLKSPKVGKHLNNRTLVLEIKERIRLLRERMSVTFGWIPREENLAGHYIENRYGL